MRRLLNVVLFSLVFCIVYCLQVFAAEWEVFVPEYEMDFIQSDSVISEPWLDEVVNVGSPGNAIYDDDFYSDFGDYADGDPIGGPFVNDGPGISLLGNYSPYDSSISTSVLTYMEDVLPKLGNVRYVLFRSGQYSYRLVYADEMTCNGGVFTASDASYVSYDTRDYRWSQGLEGDFRLNAGDVLVYSDLGIYPVLDGLSIYTWVLIFVAVLFLIFTVCRSLFSSGRMIL